MIANPLQTLCKPSANCRVAHPPITPRGCARPFEGAAHQMVPMPEFISRSEIGEWTCAFSLCGPEAVR